jgi:hypothetical protein
MDNSYLALLIFIISTLLYYLFLKPKLLTSVFDDASGKEFSQYSVKNNYSLIIYFLLVVVTQFFVNANVIINKCGGSLSQNFGASALMTFIPWFFIFGILMVILMIFPGFKSAFSNVIGYFAVAGSANKILTELLINTNIDNAINDATDADQDKKKTLENAAEAVIKLCGNMSIMINQIVPANFIEYWSILTPLMKPQYQSSGAPDLKQQLLDIVVMRDNIGEALWYVYTAVLLISITQYNITMRGCSTDLATLQANHNQVVADQAQVDAQQQKVTSNVYSISS